MADLKRTPLFEVYGQYGGKVIDFGGWELPVQFSSIKEEHIAVRTACGLFDVSHMGEITVSGSDSFSFLQHVFTNDVSLLKPKKAIYGLLCLETGATVDDLLIYMLEENNYLLVVNASNCEKDYEWLLSHQVGDVTITNVSASYAQLALQGPKAVEIMQKATNIDVANIQGFHFEEGEVLGVNAIISRTGYTGEDGFELYCPSEHAVTLWDGLLELGKELGCVPCGLGARDTLRLEAKLPLYGHELSDSISPLEAGMGFAVKFTKDFIGGEQLKKQKEDGLRRKLVGIEMVDSGIPRADYEIFQGEEKIGFVTSGTQIPSTKRNVGLALVDMTYTELGTEVEVQIRAKRVKAKVVKVPFYKREK